MVKLVLILGQLRMDSFLRCGSESSRSDAGIWAFYFLAQRCLDGLSKRTLRSPSQTLGMNGNPKRERERAHSVLLFYFRKGDAGRSMAPMVGQDVSGCLEGCPSSGERSDTWPSWDDATRAEITFWDSFRCFLLPSLLCSLSPSAFCISNHCLPVALLRRLSFLVAFAIYSTTTLEIIHFPGGPFDGYSPALGLDQVLRLAMVLRPVQVGLCTTKVLLGPSLQNVITRGCCFYQCDCLSAHIPSLQLVIGLPNSTKGTTKGHVIVSGLGLAHTSIRLKNLKLVVHWGFGRRGRPVEWVEKTSFDWLNKLFVISASERNHETLLTDQNLLSVGARRTPHVEGSPFLRGSPDSTGSPSVRDSPNRELEPVVSCIILEPEEEEEEEEEMASNLRIGFKERHHKSLSKALPPHLCLLRRSIRRLFTKPVRTLLRHKYPAATPSGDINEKDVLISSPSWEEIAQSLLFKWLEVAKTMLEFLTQRIDNDEELCAQFIRVESELLALQAAGDNNEELRTHLYESSSRMREENEVTEAKCGILNKRGPIEKGA
ncbi:hypothetical protein AAG906_032983 [Vitis piasezkii]